MMRRLIRMGSLLVVPLALLLFAQWPLRDWVQAHSSVANDVAQIVFAVYAAVAITAASRSKSHLALAMHKHSATTVVASWRTWALLVCVAPWATFLLWTAWPQMWESIKAQEIFSEGLTPGYFVVRIALVLLALLVLVDAVAQAVGDLRLRAKGRKP
ncbi:MAG: C4-dicarboxylate ABC transporter substrate-binding protein [Rhodoferax sp.]